MHKTQSTTELSQLNRAGETLLFPFSPPGGSGNHGRVDDYSDATLLLIGHGSTVNTYSRAPVCQHAAALRQRHLFAGVRECFWKEEPSIAATLDSIETPRIIAVPVFISEGYFTQERIPRELGLRSGTQTAFDRVQTRGGRRLFYASPVGTHPAMTGVLLARARDIIARHPFPRAPKPGDIALFIVGHGTGTNTHSRQSIEHQARLLRARDEYAEVHAVFMEEQPRVADCCSLTAKPNLVVVPFFISDGLHVREDIPVLLGEPERHVQKRLQQNQPPWNNPTERNGKRIWYTPAIGTEPALTDVILHLVQDITNSIHPNRSSLIDPP